MAAHIVIVEFFILVNIPDMDRAQYADIHILSLNLGAAITEEQCC